MKRYTAAVIGCSRMGGFIDNEAGESFGGRPLPYSHAAGYEAVDRTDLIACADVRPEVMARFGERYGIPPERQYTDYRELIERERPDIVSIATQPEQRTEIALFACENRVKALYCEKALCASLAETDQIVRTVKRNGVVFNMGSLRRWDAGYLKMRDIVQSGELGDLQSFIIYNTGTLFNMSSHHFDLALLIAGDPQATAVQAYIPNSDGLFEGDIVRKDPAAEVVIQLENGVKVYGLLAARTSEFEAVCTGGTVTSFLDGREWSIRRPGNATDPRGRPFLATAPFPEFEHVSPTKRLVEDLVQALDTGGPTLGGIDVARTNMELIIACLESHRRGGVRVELPLSETPLRLERDFKANQPKFEPTG